MRTLKRFENWKIEKIEESSSTCVGCGGMTDGEELCSNCEDKGWWIDPAGGVHAPDDEEDFDPAAMYESLYNEFYKDVE